MDRSAFAGSIATADRLLRVAIREAGIPIVEAVRMITETPARIMGLSSKGSLSKGKDADIAIFDSDICIKQVFAGGIPVI
jgi:N-acetylglucosamine-6-phosphate deacetylase